MLRTEAELEESLQHLAESVGGRIPNLMALEFDRLVSFEESPVRNITFTQVRTALQQNYEYHVVLHNRGTQALTPSTRILFFDKVGIQVGLGEVPVDELDPSEVRSSTGLVDVISDTIPQYFAVVTESGMLSAR